MTFQDGNGILQGESQSDREERKEYFNVVHKGFETASLYAFIRKPIANEQYNGTDGKKAQ